MTHSPDSEDNACGAWERGEVTEFTAMLHETGLACAFSLEGLMDMLEIMEIKP